MFPTALVLAGTRVPERPPNKDPEVLRSEGREGRAGGVGEDRERGRAEERRVPGNLTIHV